MKALTMIEPTVVQGQDNSLTSAKVSEIKANNEDLFHQKQ